MPLEPVPVWTPLDRLYCCSINISNTHRLIMKHDTTQTSDDIEPSESTTTLLRQTKNPWCRSPPQVLFVIEIYLEMALLYSDWQPIVSSRVKKKTLLSTSFDDEQPGKAVIVDVYIICIYT